MLKRASFSYRKLFKPFRIPSSRIFQSKRITRDGRTFILIGQQSVKHSPHILNYVVYDEANRLVIDSVAQEVYRMIMLGVIVTELQALSKTFTDQLQSESNQWIDQYGIGVVPSRVFEVWKGLMDQFSTLNKQQLWSPEDCASFRHYWLKFWEVYEERAFLLMTVPNDPVTKRKKKGTAEILDNWILREANIIKSIFSIKEIHAKGDPAHFQEWIKFNSEQALATERTAIISTKADKQSVVILLWAFLIVVLGLITPFFTYWTYRDGFAYLFIMSLFYVIYFSLYFTNKYRLRQLVYRRMSDIWRFKRKQENEQLFHLTASSISASVRTFYVVIATAVMVILQLYYSGWDGTAQFYLGLFIVTFIFSIWFPYSPYVEKEVIFFPRKIRIGHHIFQVDELRQISIDKDDIVYTFYLVHNKEPIDIHVEEEDRQETKEFVERWCADNELPFTLFNKRDR